MNEIEKMYKNAGVAKVGIKKCTTVEYLDCQNYCFISENNKCDKFSFDYPPFTAEKQIKLIRLLAKGEVKINNEDGDYEFSIFDTASDFGSFSESLADLINKMWKSLTLEEKQQVKGILE